MKVRVTHRDPSLPHQINLRFQSSHNSVTQVYCNCRPNPLGQISNMGDPWAIYNKPELHDNSRVQFEPRAHHDQNAKVYEVE